MLINVCPFFSCSPPIVGSFQQTFEGGGEAFPVPQNLLALDLKRLQRKSLPLMQVGQAIQFVGSREKQK